MPTVAPSPTPAPSPTATPSPTAAPFEPFTDDFESGDLARWTKSEGIAVQNQDVAAGQYAVQVSGKGERVARYAQADLVTTTELYYRARVKLPALPSQTIDVFQVNTAAGAKALGVTVDSRGRLGTRSGIDSRSNLVSSSRLAVGVWYEVQIHVKIAGTSSVVEVWLNGSRVNILSRTARLGTAALTQVQIGTTSTGRTLAFMLDDVDTGLSKIAALPAVQPASNMQEATPRKARCAVEPAKAEVGQEVAVSCTKLQPGESAALVWDDGTTVATIEASAKGKGGVSFVVPVTTGGRHKLRVKRADGPDASLTVTVAPSLTLAKRSVRVGGELSVALYGFGSGEEITFVVGQSVIGRGFVTAGDGTLAVTLAIPDDLAGGSTKLIARGGSGAKASASIRITKPAPVVAEPTPTSKPVTAAKPEPTVEPAPTTPAEPEPVTREPDAATPTAAEE